MLPVCGNGNVNPPSHIMSLKSSIVHGRDGSISCEKKAKIDCGSFWAKSVAVIGCPKTLSLACTFPVPFQVVMNVSKVMSIVAVSVNVTFTIMTLLGGNGLCRGHNGRRY